MGRSMVLMGRSMASGSDFPDSTSPLDPLDPVVTCRAHDAHFDDVATLPLLRHGVELAATVDAKDVAPDLGLDGGRCMARFRWFISMGLWYYLWLICDDMVIW